MAHGLVGDAGAPQEQGRLGLDVAPVPDAPPGRLEAGREAAGLDRRRERRRQGQLAHVRIERHDGRAARDARAEHRQPLEQAIEARHVRQHGAAFERVGQEGQGDGPLQVGEQRRHHRLEVGDHALAAAVDFSTTAFSRATISGCIAASGPRSKAYSWMSGVRV